MMKLLIVEDEEIIRQGIVKKVANCKLPIDSIVETGDGISAMEIMENDTPDIVLTDIRMPGLDGISFIELAKTTYEKIQFIVISGYSDFDYARRVMRQNVSHYLLKPVNDKELKEALQQCIEKISEQRETTKRLEQMDMNQQLSEETIRQYMLTKLVQQGDIEIGDKEKWNSYVETLPQRVNYYQTIIFKLEPFQMPLRSFLIGDERLVWFAIKNMVNERFLQAGIAGLLFEHAINDFELVFVVGFERQEQTMVMEQLLQAVITDNNHFLKLEMTIGVGSIVKQIDHMQQSYQQAKYALCNRILQGTKQVYEALVRNRVERRLLLTEQDEEMLLYWLKNNQYKAVNQWLERAVLSIAEDKSANYFHLEWYCMDFYLLLRKYLLKETNMTEWLIGEVEDLIQYIQSASNVKEVITRMQQYIHNIQGYWHSNASTSDVMEEIKQYIDDNFHEPLTLQSIADQYFIHPNYFSRRFKERFGEKFIDYLTKLRMNRAMQLMSETTMKIFEIAELVGYEDAAYFGSVFRKIFGMTPKQYRDQLP
ncbi:helix-turn-helix domain-containing protein [Paenibacillus yanchengensis]|uniref:Helix-turn-helix domain-containing protein n=1 Tax=Paenibacillus yanchengensis TaxID=2035833 RepID=A0ABW4YHJ6_9BACL